MQLKEKIEGVIRSKRKSGSRKALPTHSLMADLHENEPIKCDENNISTFKSERYRLNFDPTDRIITFGESLYFFDMIQIGGPSAVKEIEKMLENDPKLDFFPKGHPYTLANLRNSRDQTALYLAVQNNNLDVVMLLVEHGADIKALSTIDAKDDQKEQESNLEVAARWGFGPIIEFLLNRASWTKDELNRALSLASTKDARDVIKKRRKSSSFGGCRSPFCLVF